MGTVSDLSLKSLDIQRPGGIMCDHLLRIPNGKRIWFWYKTAPPAAAPADANYLRIRKQSKNSAYSQQSRPISNIVLTD